MERSQPTQRLGVLAFAFDVPGRRLLDALTERPDLGQSLVLCHHAAEGGGDAETDLKPMWFRRSPGTSWEVSPWSSGLVDLIAGYEAAVRDALDARRWQIAGQGVDLVELLLISPAAPSGPQGLPPGTLEALMRLRRRYRRIGRILLVTEGAFETVGESSVPGRLASLPFADVHEGDDGVLFDLILLLDRVNLEGMVLVDEEQATAQTAAAVIQLTIGELSTTLWESLQAESARLRGGGRYVSLGVAEWRLDPRRAVAVTGNLLFRRMAAVVSSQAEEAAKAAELGPEPAGAEPKNAGGTERDEPSSASDESEFFGPTVASNAEPDSTNKASRDSVPGGGGAPGRPEDSWLTKVPQAIEAVTLEHQDQQLDLQEELNLASLRESVARNGWSIEHLLHLLDCRVRSLQEIERRKSGELAVFMQRFAPWYARKKARVTDRQPASGEILQQEVLSHQRVALFVASLLLALAAGVAAAMTEYRWELGSASGLFAMVATTVVSRGLHVTRAVPVLPSSKPPEPDRDLVQELRLLRARLMVSAELRRRNELTAKRLSEALATLKTTEANAALRMDTFPFSEPVCSALLSHRGLITSACLARFWDELGTEVLADLIRGGDGLPARLRGFAIDCCRHLAGIEWGEIIQALEAGGSIVPPLLWRQELERSRNAAVPRMPVEGKSTYTFLALPQRLPESLKDALENGYPGQVIKIGIDGEAVLVVRVTQGYDAGRNPGAHHE